MKLGLLFGAVLALASAASPKSTTPFCFVWLVRFNRMCPCPRRVHQADHALADRAALANMALSHGCF